MRGDGGFCSRMGEISNYSPAIKTQMPLGLGSLIIPMPGKLGLEKKRMVGWYTDRCVADIRSAYALLACRSVVSF